VQHEEAAVEQLFYHRQQDASLIFWQLATSSYWVTQSIALM
jgi:hypothetical protein